MRAARCEGRVSEGEGAEDVAKGELARGGEELDLGVPGGVGRDEDREGPRELEQARAG